MCGFYSKRCLLLIRRETTTLDATELVEAAPFADIDDDEDKLEENELVLEDC